MIQTTSSHQFWDQTAGRWVKAAALKYGYKLGEFPNVRVNVTTGQ